MTVYVESGFLLTLALKQDDYQATERILELAQQRRIVLKIPAFSLSEPFATVQYRANSRNRLIDELQKEIRELRRTQPHQSMAEELGQYTLQMAQVLLTQQNEMEAVVLELGRNCDLLPLDATTLTRASSYKTAYKLQLQDAIILASIILDLERQQTHGDALFISQNKRDFLDPDIQAELQSLGCKYLSDFTNAVRFIERPGGEADQSS